MTCPQLPCQHALQLPSCRKKSGHEREGVQPACTSGFDFCTVTEVKTVGPCKLGRALCQVSRLALNLLSSGSEARFVGAFQGAMARTEHSLGGLCFGAAARLITPDLRTARQRRHAFAAWSLEMSRRFVMLRTTKPQHAVTEVEFSADIQVIASSKCISRFPTKRLEAINI